MYGAVYPSSMGGPLGSPFGALPYKDSLDPAIVSPLISLGSTPYTGSGVRIPNYQWAVSAPFRENGRVAFGSQRELTPGGMGVSQTTGKYFMGSRKKQRGSRKKQRGSRKSRGLRRRSCFGSCQVCGIR
jgi:hypothetical protein